MEELLPLAITIIFLVGAAGIAWIIALCIYAIDAFLYQRCEKNHPRYFRMIDQNEELSFEIDKVKAKLAKCKKVCDEMPKGTQKHLSMCKIIMTLNDEIKNYEECFDKRAAAIIKYREKNKIKYW